MSPVSTRVGGVWKDVASVHTKVSGSWKTAADMPVNVGGVWKTGILAAGAFESIATAIGTGSSATITFSSIPQTYKSLQLRIIGLDSGSGSRARMYVNGSSSGYTHHEIYGNGTNVQINGQTSQSSIILLNNNSAGLGTTNPIVCITDIIDYADTSKNKTIRTISGQDSNGSGYVGLSSSLYPSTSAITTLQVFTQTGSNFASGTTIALYGIKGA